MSWFSRKVNKYVDRVKENVKNPKAWANAMVTGGASFLGNEDFNNIVLGGQGVIGAAALSYGLANGMLGAGAAYGPTSGAYSFPGSGMFSVPASGASGFGLAGLGKLGLGAGLLGANYYQNYKNYELQKEYAEENADMQRENFEYQKWLNDHGIGSQLSQYQAAGINPLAATAGSQSSAGATPVEAPQQENIFGDVFTSLMNKNNIDNQLKSQKEIAYESNKTSLDIAGINSSTSKAINQANINADVQKYIFEQGEITRRHMADLIQNDKHFTVQQKIKLIESINSQSMQNQMNKVNYEQKRQQLVQDISKHAYTLFTGKPVDLSTFKKSFTDKLIDVGITLKQQAETEFSKLYNGIKGFFYDKSKTPEQKRSFINTEINNFIRTYMVDEYKDVSTANLEKLLEVLSNGK